jgi:branched-chain amino acid transport system permease protein
VLVTIWSGLVLGAIYALIATGFTIAMLPTGVFNFAHGAIVVGGSFLTYQFLAVNKLPSVLAVILTMLAGTVLGVLCELLTVRPLRAATGTVGTGALVTTVGASTAIAGWVGVKWGYIPLLVPFVGPGGFVHAFGILMRPVEITVVALAVVSAVACELVFRKTRQGQACLAVAEDIEPAMLRGINVSRFSLIAFALSGMFGALAGVLVGPITYADPTLAPTLALTGFVAVALGGEGSFVGGLIGGIVVGLVSTLATRYVGANYGNTAVLVLLLVALSLKPKGLGGQQKARIV